MVKVIVVAKNRPRSEARSPESEGLFLACARICWNILIGRTDVGSLVKIFFLLIIENNAVKKRLD